MSIFEAILLAIVEGLTEFIPVSSTGHLVLVHRALGIASTDFVKSFELAIQLAAILAVVVLYRKRLQEIWSLKTKILAAFIPTAIVGFALYTVIKNIFLENALIVVIALIVGGVLLIFFEMYFSRSDRASTQVGLAQITHTQSFLIGLCQSLSVVPGVSRSGASIIGGLATGLNRVAAVEFSFLLAIPTIIAAVGYDFLKTGASAFAGEYDILTIGFVVSFIVSWIVMVYFLKFVSKHTMIGFGVYRILLGFLYLLIFV